MAITTKEELLAHLSDLDTASAAELAQIEERLATTEAALSTAGSEYDEQVNAAEAEAAGALGDYNTAVEAAGTAKNSAEAAAEEAPVIDATVEIAGIEEVLSPPVTSNNQADIQLAFDSLTDSFNATLNELKGVLLLLNNPQGISKLKEAVTHLSDCAGSIIQAGLPPAGDTQADIDQAFGTIDGLRG